MARNLLSSVLKIFRPSVINIRYYAAAKSESKTDRKVPPPSKVSDRRIFKIYRYGGIKTKETPSMQSYELDINSCGKMLLDVMIKLKDMDPTLTFRRSCREGICGSCGVCLQGSNCLACITKVPDAKTITIHPLPHMYVQRDLVVDMTHFLNSYDSIKPYLIRKSAISPMGSEQYAQSIPDSLKFLGLYECILCGCCSTSCPSYWWNGRRFLGPCTLLHAYRWVIDSRDEDHDNRLSSLRDDFQAFRCHSIFNCILVCPKHLRPGKAIAKLKRMIVGLDKKPRSEMDPMEFKSGSSGLDGCGDRTQLPKALKKLLVPKVDTKSSPGNINPCKAVPKSTTVGYPCEPKMDDSCNSIQNIDPCDNVTQKEHGSNPCQVGMKQDSDDPCKKKEDICIPDKKKHQCPEKKSNDPCKPKKQDCDDPCKPKKQDCDDPCKPKKQDCDDPCKPKKQDCDDPCKPKKQDCDDPCKPKKQDCDDPCKPRN